MKIFSKSGRFLQDWIPPRIAIVGMQHQGPILATGFANLGYRVYGIDENQSQIDKLNKAESGLNEPNLDRLLNEHLNKSGGLKFTTSYTDGLLDADFVFLSIDVPFDEKGLQLESVLVAAHKIHQFGFGDYILCVTSQVPVGTTETLTKHPVAYIPEFLRPGNSVWNFRYADRIVIGCDNEKIGDYVASLYEPLNQPILRMGVRSAEMSKHAHNAILATQISFANEIAALCEKVGADSKTVAEAVKADHRVGAGAYVNPGWSLKNGHLIRDIRVLRDLQFENKLSTGFMDEILFTDGRL